MKVFVSGQLLEKEKINEIYALLQNRGHVVTHDWTKTDNIVGGYSDNVDEAALRAKKDIDGVLAADCYIIVTDNIKCGKGMYVELGAALAAAALKPGGMEVILLGPSNHESIFYYHPQVRRMSDLNEVLEFLSAKEEDNRSITT